MEEYKQQTGFFREKTPSGESEARGIETAVQNQGKVESLLTSERGIWKQHFDKPLNDERRFVDSVVVDIQKHGCHHNNSRVLRISFLRIFVIIYYTSKKPAIICHTA